MSQGDVKIYMCNNTCIQKSDECFTVVGPLLMGRTFGSCNQYVHFFNKILLVSDILNEYNPPISEHHTFIYDTVVMVFLVYAGVNWHLEPTLLKSSPFHQIIGSRIVISSPLFQNNLVKIHHNKNKIGWRFTKLICFFLGQDSVSN